jgi:hypothetical protein
MEPKEQLDLKGLLDLRDPRVVLVLWVYQAQPVAQDLRVKEV